MILYLKKIMVWKESCSSMRKNNYIIYIILYNFTRESHIIRLIYTNFIINKVIVSKIKPQFSEGFTFRVCLLSVSLQWSWWGQNYKNKNHGVNTEFFFNLILSQSNSCWQTLVSAVILHSFMCAEQLHKQSGLKAWHHFPFRCCNSIQALIKDLSYQSFWKSELKFLNFEFKQLQLPLTFSSAAVYVLFFSFMISTPT